MIRFRRDTSDGGEHGWKGYSRSLFELHVVASRRVLEKSGRREIPRLAYVRCQKAENTNIHACRSRKSYPRVAMMQS